MLSGDDCFSAVFRGADKKYLTQRECDGILFKVVMTMPKTAGAKHISMLA